MIRSPGKSKDKGLGYDVIRVSLLAVAIYLRFGQLGCKPLLRKIDCVDELVACRADIRHLPGNLAQTVCHPCAQSIGWFIIVWVDGEMLVEIVVDASQQRAGVLHFYAAIVAMRVKHQS